VASEKFNYLFFQVEIGGHDDNRRTITDIVFPDGFQWPFRIQQIKVLDFKSEAATQRLPVGNHYHKIASGRRELFVAVGPADTDLFILHRRYRTRKGSIETDQTMRVGDACYIPPNVTHTFVPLNPNAKLWGFSNTKYDAKHDVLDKLA